MNSVYNKEKDRWLHPWNIKQFDDSYNRDERFFSNGTEKHLSAKGILRQTPPQAVFCCRNQKTYYSF